MENIQFNDYTPPPPPLDVVNITLGIFFDGTLNNKTNTDARRGILESEGKKAHKKHGGDSDENTSYNNDWSNVARLWENYNKSNSIYVEGIGTEDLKGDEMDGYAYGSKDTGIKAKVKISCERIAIRLKAFKDRNPKSFLGTITFDVFGFSRGAAAARHFVYEVSKRNKSEIFGILGRELQNKEINVDGLNIDIRFLGIFDTVSSYSEDVWTTDPDFSNDIGELHIDDITKAQKIVHFVAENEHRVNFDLTDLIAFDKVKRRYAYMGIERIFPGVHCDIGGAYEDGDEKKDEIINGDEKVLTDRKAQLVAEGWFEDKELIIHEKLGKLSSNRYVKKTYSYIPLQFMAGYCVESKIPLDKSQIEDGKYTISKDQFLISVKKRLNNYVMGNGKKPYKFRWFHEIHKQYKGSKIPEQKYAEYQKELAEQKELRKLRHEYLHWSADYDWVGMDPREDGKRVVH